MLRPSTSKSRTAVPSSILSKGSSGSSSCRNNHVEVNGATTSFTSCVVGFLGPLPFFCTVATHDVFRAPLSVAVRKLSSESAPCVTWSVFGSPPLQFVPPLPGGRRPLTHSPRREVVSGPAHTRGAHPTASGRHAMTVRTQPLWVASPGVIESAPFSQLIGPWVVALHHTNGGVVYVVVPCGHRGSSFYSVGVNNNSSQPSRGCLHRLQKMVNVPHHCLETLAFAMRASSAFAFRDSHSLRHPLKLVRQRVLRLRCRCRRHSTQDP